MGLAFAFAYDRLANASGGACGSGREAACGYCVGIVGGLFAQKARGTVPMAMETTILLCNSISFF